MSRLLVTNKSFELLEPYEGKLSRTVLRGESSRKGADLLDIFRISFPKYSWRISLSLQLPLESSKHLCPHTLTANITS